MKRFTTVITVALMLLLALPAAAQWKKDKDKENANQRSAQGVVMDAAENPLEGAVVQLKDSKTLQIRSFITKTNGAYHFYSLSTDTDYELKATYQGKSSNSRTLSSFDGRKQAVMNLKIEK